MIRASAAARALVDSLVMVGGYRSGFVGAALMSCLLCACDGPAAADAGPRDARTPPDHTALQIWSALPGASATVAGTSVSLDDDGNGDMSIEPPLTEGASTLEIERAGARVELPFEWWRELDELRLPRTTPLERLTLILYADGDGECALAATNGGVQERRWSGGLAPPEVCGPFR